MNKSTLHLIDKLSKEHSLSLDEYEYVVSNRDADSIEHARNLAVALRKEIYGNSVYVRGLIEISNICKNNCLYCGIRAGNSECERYRVGENEILGACEEGYALGFRTFVLQGGEDGYFTDEVLCDIVSKIKQRHGDCAVTLSVGERSRQSYEMLFAAGADRYLLRHETASPEHYTKLHPDGMSFENRMRCLKDLKEIGFQTGCGFMVGSPYQTVANIASDLKFIEEFHPEMCGIGPFIPHKATVFAKESAGSMELSCYLLSLVRLILPSVLLPSTTALGTLEEYGREKGILSGANVVMPNLSPIGNRAKYELYNNKLCTKAESAQALEEIRTRIRDIGYEIVCDRGDAK